MTSVVTAVTCPACREVAGELPPTRGRETSEALTEVRTVLSRAETARWRLDGPIEHRYEDADGIRRWHSDAISDPEADDMRAAMEQVIALLARWRRTGR